MATKTFGKLCKYTLRGITDMLGPKEITILFLCGCKSTNTTLSQAVSSFRLELDPYLQREATHGWPGVVNNLSSLTDFSITITQQPVWLPPMIFNLSRLPNTLASICLRTTGSLHALTQALSNNDQIMQRLQSIEIGDVPININHGVMTRLLKAVSARKSVHRLISKTLGTMQHRSAHHVNIPVSAIPKNLIHLELHLVRFFTDADGVSKLPERIETLALYDESDDRHTRPSELFARLPTNLTSLSFTIMGKGPKITAEDVSKLPKCLTELNSDYTLRLAQSSADDEDAFIQALPPQIKTLVLLTPIPKSWYHKLPASITKISIIPYGRMPHKFPPNITCLQGDTSGTGFRPIDEQVLLPRNLTSLSLDFADIRPRLPPNMEGLPLKSLSLYNLNRRTPNIAIPKSVEHLLLMYEKSNCARAIMSNLPPNLKSLFARDCLQSRSTTPNLTPKIAHRLPKSITTLDLGFSCTPDFFSSASLPNLSKVVVNLHLLSHDFADHLPPTLRYLEIAIAFLVNDLVTKQPASPRRILRNLPPKLHTFRLAISNFVTVTEEDDMQHLPRGLVLLSFIPMPGTFSGECFGYLKHLRAIGRGEILANEY